MGGVLGGHWRGASAEGNKRCGIAKGMAGAKVLGRASGQAHFLDSQMLRSLVKAGTPGQAGVGETRGGTVPSWSFIQSTRGRPL